MGKKNTISLVLVMTTVLLSQSVWAEPTERNQAKRIHDRLTGVPATNATIDAMEALLMRPELPRWTLAWQNCRTVCDRHRAESERPLLL